MSHKQAFSVLGALVLSAALLADCTAAGAPCPPTAQPEPSVTGYRLGSGDMVRLAVFQQPDLSGEFRLDGDGDLALPLAGEIHAGQLTTRELEAAVEARLRDGDYLRNPQVSIQVLSHRPVYILGEINQPGQYEYTNGMSIINAVAEAGGYTYRARASKATIERGGCTVSAAAPDTLVLPGDIIRIPERFF